MDEKEGNERESEEDNLHLASQLPGYNSMFNNSG